MPENQTGRIEAFSDGIFAVAVTLLVLDIKVPAFGDLHGQGLGRALELEWPHFLAYLTSFVTILIMWVNHHKLFNTIARINHNFMIANGLLLMSVTVVPFTTALAAEYIGKPDAGIAAAVLSGSYVVISLFYNLVWRTASHNGRLLKKSHDAEFAKDVSRKYLIGPIGYTIAFLLSFVRAELSIGLVLLMAVYFALPTTSNSTEDV